MSWVAERNAQIVALRKRGLQPKQIADQMGLSRNQVLGTLFRAGMCRKGSATAKLTPDQVEAIRVRYKRRCGTNGSHALAKAYGVCHSTILDVVWQRTWKVTA